MEIIDIIRTKAEPPTKDGYILIPSKELFKLTSKYYFTESELKSLLADINEYVDWKIKYTSTVLNLTYRSNFGWLFSK